MKRSSNSCTATTSPKQEKRQCTSDYTVDPVMASRVVKCLGYHWDREDFRDFIVQVEKREFKCHRFMLGSCSSFFSGLLRSNMKDSASGKVVIKDISSEIFELILDALYKGRNILTSENVLEVWHAANQLHIPFLLTACEEFVMGNITVDNFMDIHDNATLLNSQRVLQAVRQMMVCQFDKVMRSSDLFDVSVDDLLAVVGSQDVNVCANGLVQAILAWITTTFPESVVELKKQDSPGNLPIKHRPTFLETVGELKKKDSSGNVPIKHRPTFLEAFGELKKKDSSGNVPIKPSTGVKERLKHLNTLLGAIKLDQITDALLGQLINNETVLACPKTTRTLNKIAAQRLNGRGGNNCYGGGYMNCSNYIQHGRPCALHQNYRQTSAGYPLF